MWGLGPNVDVLVRPPQTTMLLGDFFELSRRHDNAKTVTLASPHSNAPTLNPNTKLKSTKAKAKPKPMETFYLEYLSLYQYLGQPFLDLIPMPAAVNTSSLTHLVTNLWIGNKPTISPLHYDDYENLLCQIQGTKELVLFPPSDVSFLYYVGRPKGTLQYEFPGQFIRDKATVDSRSFVFGSSVHVDSPDEVRHPLYKRAHPLHVLLNKGDVLYLPAYWHHEVQSIPDEKEGINVAVNFWFANMTASVEGMV
jgi:jumonji domain-containing protein 7